MTETGGTYRIRALQGLAKVADWTASSPEEARTVAAEMKGEFPAAEVTVERGKELLLVIRQDGTVTTDYLMP